MIRSGASGAARRGALAAVVAMAAVGVGSAGGTPSPGRLGELAPVAPAPAHVGEGVLRALEHRGEVAVLVTLRQAAAGAAGARLSRDEIAAARERALARAGDGVDLGIAYTAVPAFSALVTRDGLDELLSAPDVLSVDLPLKFRRALADGVSLVRANQVHAQGLTGAGVTVAVIDSGIDTTHPDLADDVVGEACFVRLENGTGGCPDGTRRKIGPGTAPDADGHGTAVAGIVTSRGVVAARGVAPDAKVLAIKVFPSAPESQSDSRDTLAALDWLLVARPDVRVVNLSLGGDPVVGPCDASSTGATAYASAVAALRARGVTVVAASGNEASTTGISPPACVSGAISVGAVYDANQSSYATDTCTDSSTAPDMVACYSNGGPGLDLLAPGPGTLAPKPGGGTDDFGGTSAAAPFVTGVAALLLQARPRIGPDQVESALVQSGVPVLDARTGRATPRVDARAALDVLSTLPDAAPRQTLPAGASAFADAAGDGGSGADLTDVRVSSYGDGLLTFAISVPNRSSLGPADAIQIMIDADRNPGTGTSTGADFAVAVFPSGSPEVYRWSASAWQFHGLLDDAVFAGGTLTLTLDEARIGAAGDFGFLVVSFANRFGADVAPASGSWPHPNHALGVTRSGTGSGTISGGGANGIACGARCSAGLARGASVTLTAAAAPGSVFLDWGGACSGTAGCALTMDGPKDVSARFEALRRLTVTHAGTGAGAVTSAPGGISCGATCAADFPHGVPLSLIATPVTGSSFEGWSGGCSGTGACSLTPAGETAVTATFRDVQAPRATALPSSGRRGRRAALRYRLLDNSGRSAALVTVQAGARRLARLSRPLARATGSTASLAWGVPRSVNGRQLRFCVVAVDAGGNRGSSSCARLTVR